MLVIADHQRHDSVASGPVADLKPLSSLAEPLATWFDRHARPLPWRTDRTPYRVWIAEIMLQQTRVETIRDRFQTWMQRFPTLDALAQAREEEVLALWEGLGYYRRARALHRAARHLSFDHKGRFPSDEDGWRALPGIGPYTAAAIVAFAYGHRAVAVDGNVRRVGARLLALAHPNDRDLKARLAALLPRERPERGTEALIELGAVVCTPRAPRCAVCPLAPGCTAFQNGTTATHPAPRSPRPIPRRERFGLVHLRNGSIWLERRPSEGLLGGLWGVPQCEDPVPGRRLEPLHHTYSHFQLRLIPIVTTEGPASEGASEARWLDADACRATPVSTLDRTLLARLEADGLLRSSA